MKVVSVNRYASFEYELLDKFVAGIVLSGSEIKSVRAGNINIKDAFAVVKEGSLELINCFIASYKNAFINDSTQERRSRRLLLTKKELKKIIGVISLKGLTVVPLKAFIGEKGFLKIELAVAKHKKLHDKRQDLKEKDLKREVQKELKNFRS